ncbi:MAG: uroporphyrinogen decarboxylase family protein [Candidatus Latescibacteria bacterium]|jgi:uroporphyrinogen decarboxylase|nr:uroporphyrinogen decarboxylase family protein [Candidatus Latescibacterota bacterium]
MDEMTARERVLAAMDRQPTDRVSTDIWATAEAWDKLVARFGSREEALRQLHIDGIASVGAAYVGPPYPAAPQGETSDMWGIRTKPVEYEGGVYQEQSYNPLAEARKIDDLESYRWPGPDWFDYSGMREAAGQKSKLQAVECGYMAPFYQHNKLRGLEASLIDPLEDPEFTHHLLNRLCDFLYAYHERMFEACDGLIDVAQVTDDLGSQTGPLISLDVYREFYAPHHRRFTDLCHGFGIRVFHHDDGSMRAFLPDLVEMGIDVLNPVQWTCRDMDRAELKRDFGDRICFHGGVDNQRILPFGTEAEVREEVRHCIDTLASDGKGYILAPCHNIQAISPVENIVAMYEEAWEYGRY